MKMICKLLLMLVPSLLLSCGKEPGAGASLDDIVFNGPEKIELMAGESIELSLSIPSGLKVDISWVYDRKVLSTSDKLAFSVDSPQEGTLTIILKDSNKKTRTIERPVLVLRKEGGYKVIGYLPQYKNTTDIPWGKLTHVNLAFAKVKSDGTLDDAGIRNVFGSLSRTASSYGVRLVLSLGGGGGSDEQAAITAALLNENARKKIVQNAVKTVQDLSLAGIDLDYEDWDWGKGSGNVANQAAVLDLLTQLRSELGNASILSAAASVNTFENGWYSSEIISLLDYITIMTYDKTGTWSASEGPHAPYDYFTGACVTAVNLGIPKEKIIPGIPFYGRIFPSGKPANSYIITYSDIVKTYSGAENKDSIESEHLWYDGVPMVTRKTQYVKEQELGGVMIWEITQDATTASASLLNAINATLN